MMKMYRDLRGWQLVSSEEVKDGFMEEMERNKGEMIRTLQSVS